MPLFVKLQKKISNLKFRDKMSFIYICCVLIPLLIISMVYYGIISRKLLHQQLADINHEVERAYYGLENIFESAEVISDSLYYNYELYDLLDSSYTEMGKKMRTSMSIDRIVKSLLIRESIEDVTIYTDNPSLYRSESVVKKTDISSDAAWMEAFEKTGSSMATISYYSDAYKQYEISIIRRMDYIAMEHSDCIMKIDISVKDIANTLKINSDKGICFLSNDKGVMLAAGQADILDNPNIDNGSGINAKTVSFPNGYYVSSVSMKRRMLSLFPEEVAWFLIMIVLLAVVALVIIYLVTGTFVKKLTQLTDCTVNMTNDIFELVPDDGVGGEEIVRLTRGLNNAILRINTLINDIYQMKILQLEAENEKNKAQFKALSSQINPHFMFNTFDVMRMKNKRDGNTETAEIMKQLSDIFRKLITWDSDMITIQEELEFVNSYLLIQEYNNDSDFEIRTDIAPDAVSALIPKMTIQVLVENAFVHGIDKILDNKLIRLSVKKENDDIYITVSDNGPGFRQELAEALNIGDAELMKTKRIGIKNIVSRIKLYFHDDYSIKVVTVPHKNTEVCIRIPYTNEPSIQKSVKREE